MKNTLSVKTMFSLCSWLRDNAAAVAGKQYRPVAEMATQALGLPITISNIRAASEATGVQVGKVQAVQVDPHTQAVAQELVRFMRAFAFNVPERLDAIAGTDRAQLGLPGVQTPE